MSIERKTWNDFRQAKLLWWINRILHTFGWAIVCEVGEDGSVSEVYPAKVSFRGFSEEDEADGYEGMAKTIRGEE